MIAFEAFLVIAGTPLIHGAAIGAPAHHHHGFMLGAAAAGIPVRCLRCDDQGDLGPRRDPGPLSLLSPWTALTVARL